MMRVCLDWLQLETVVVVAEDLKGNLLFCCSKMKSRKEENGRMTIKRHHLSQDFDDKTSFYNLSLFHRYYLMPEKTAEDFEDSHGRRWFKTGDIGEFQHNGTLKIIDRKKDLVKLQYGEYVSLGKVESCLKTCPVVENVCIYGESKYSYAVALVCPDRAVLKTLAEKFGKADMTFEGMCEDRDLTGAVLRELVNHGKKHKLEKFEIPGAVTLCKELWLPDSGLVTAAFKLKRKPIQEHYQKDLDRMYGTGSRGV